MGQFPRSAYQALAMALYFPFEGRYAYDVQRTITEQKRDIKQTYAKWQRLRDSSGDIG
jgi:hypothetical protein